MRRLMFITLGTSEGSVEGVVHSVRQYNPDHVVFLTTQKSRQRQLPEVVERVGLEAVDADGESKGPRWTYSAPEAEELERVHDVERLHLAYRRLVEEAFATHGGAVENAVADFSHGTRPMSIALFQAAYSAGIQMLAYVSGERDADGDVIRGTETTYEVYGRRLRAFERLQEAVELFNRGDYSAARRAAEILESTPEIHLPHGGDGRALVGIAASAFEAWDRFRLEEALEELQKLGEPERVDPGFVARHLMSTEEREAVRQRHLAMATKRPMYFGLLADVVANAERRIDQKAWDDAVGRLYRAIEYVAQLRIWDRWEVETAEFPVENLPAPVRERIAIATGAQPGETRTLSMRVAWEVLEAAGDPLGERFAELLAETELERALRKRNMSILAHGFESVGAEYARTLRTAVERLVRAGWGEEKWESALEACVFPVIDGLSAVHGGR